MKMKRATKIIIMVNRHSYPSLLANHELSSEFTYFQERHEVPGHLINDQIKKHLLKTYYVSTTFMEMPPCTP